MNKKTNKNNKSIDKNEKSTVRMHYDALFESKLQEQLIAGEFQYTSALHSMVTGQSEVERRWNLQSKLYPKIDDSLPFITFKNCSELINNQHHLKNWDCFKLGAARKMREIAINAPK